MSLHILLLIWLILIVKLAQTGLVNKQHGYKSPKHFDFPDLYNVSFGVHRPSLVWVDNDSRDGIFTYTDPTTRNLLLKSIEDGKTEVFVRRSDLVIDGEYLEVESFELSQDAKYLLLKTNVSSQWRHSEFSNMYIYDIATKSLTELDPYLSDGFIPHISYAVWSPTGHKLAFVAENDIFVSDLTNVTRVTFDGSDNVFNGKPDWVYEEEIFSKDYALWWSPDSTHIAYLRFNESSVPEFHLQYYVASNNSYPDETAIKYPKAGSPNPSVSLRIYSLKTSLTTIVTSSADQESNIIRKGSYIEFVDENRLITEVMWSTDTNTHILFKQTNRVQDIEITSLVSLGESPKKTYVDKVRVYKPKDGGWIESSQSMIQIVNKKNQTEIDYLDVIDDGNGFMHLAIISVNNPENPLWLTSGNWEVIPDSVEIDYKRRLLHFISTERSSLERHLYRIDLNNTDPSSTKKCITCPKNPSQHGVYSAKFSPKKGFYILQYNGPGVPTTVVRKVDNDKFEIVLQGNDNLKALLSNYDLPKSRLSSRNIDGIQMNVKETLPPGFNSSKKYPVLFNVYGGPESQLVNYEFGLSWSTFLASKLGYIIVNVDGRGTGFKGRRFRSVIRGRLGELETIDQINAARHWSKLKYVDSSRIAIWGWSYGGFMTSKVIEANSGIFSVGIAVAPVTDWRFYDSIYTERYMLTPELNPDGYARSAVNKMEGFKNAKFLLAHGTGDDNVHFQNSAALVDKFTQANVYDYKVQFYTDNSHSINSRNANQNLYHLLTNFLSESFGQGEYFDNRKNSSNPLLHTKRPFN